MANTPKKRAPALGKAQRDPRKATSAQAWKANRATTELEVPSGNVALVRLLGPEAFLGQGKLPDSLAPIVEAAIREGKGMPPEKIKEIQNDPQQILEAMEFINHVLVQAVVEPTVAVPPYCDECEQPQSHISHQPGNPDFHSFREAERDGDVLYADEVDWDDKVFIFQFVVGGTRDLETFRKQQAATMASMVAGEKLSD